MRDQITSKSQKFDNKNYNGWGWKNWFIGHSMYCNACTGDFSKKLISTNICLVGFTVKYMINEQT